MRKTLLTTACATVIALSGIVAASAQTSTPGAPAGNQTNVTGPATTDTSMNSNAKMKKKKMKKSTKKDDGMMEKGGMEKKM